jgi:hypothetical protein
MIMSRDINWMAALAFCCASAICSCTLNVLWLEVKTEYIDPNSNVAIPIAINTSRSVNPLSLFLTSLNGKTPILRLLNKN